VEKVARGLARAGSLPELDTPDASLIAGRLDKWMRRAAPASYRPGVARGFLRDARRRAAVRVSRRECDGAAGGARREKRTGAAAPSCAVIVTIQ
jgi:hypothetical protein